MSDCRVCGGLTEFAVLASERMLGLGGEFPYDRCHACGCVQIREVPPDLDRYYPSHYYAFRERNALVVQVRRALRRVRDALVFGAGWRVGRWIAPALSPAMLSMRQWLERTGTTRSSRILDVGCGAGDPLGRLVDQGYQHVRGVDPFISGPIYHDGRLLVQKGTLSDVEGKWDLIMFHHSLEHIEDQRGMLARVAQLLTPDGWCLIRVPTVDSDAWDEYRDRWVQLDAPRHLTLHSTASMERLADSVGLRVEAVVHDSTAFQFEGSELYRRDRPLSDLASSGVSRQQRRSFAARAAALNLAGRGDQAAFFLRRR
jgi:2-polyprenyl-3-methyl-5-hydroxy-6-metoxy-1,4-benzoquinol methylase